MTEKSGSVCVDASLALAWLLADIHSEQADSLWQEWTERAIDLVAPPMFHAEVASSLRKNVYFNHILPAEGERLFTIYSEIPVRIIEGQEMRQKAWQLSKEFNLPVCYDMQYLAVAELEGCDLWTLDRRLINAVRGNKRVRWVRDYNKRPT